MSVESALSVGRAAAESAMVDTFTAYAPSTVVVDGLNEDSWTPQYVTPGKIQGPSRQSTTQTRTITIGSVERLVVEGGLHIPYGASLPAEGWEFECDAVGDPINAFRVGRRWRIVEVPLDDATARRLSVVEVPPEVTP